jgi:hypothetical protein
MDQLCACGCREKVVPGRQYRQGHWSRTKEARIVNNKKRKIQRAANPSGFCFCGCGEKTPIATRNKPERGYYAGQHVRYIRGHQVRTGSENPRWKGGKIVRSDGYIEVFAPNHPDRNGKGYILEHRLVMEKKIGRRLTKKERVHHINGIKSDNRPRNLVLLRSQSEHIKGHDYLGKWRKKYPEKAREEARKAGRKGAEARWEWEKAEII